MIEELKKQRELEIERAGKAMRDAIDLEQKQLEEKRLKNEQAIRAHKAARQRGQQALLKERQLIDEKAKLEEQIKQLDRKKLVQQQESQHAHDLAQ